MPSPFPGMDPYLERHWRDVHAALVSEARFMLNGRLPPDLLARCEERVVLGDDQPRTRAYFPDVRVEQPYPAADDDGGVAVLAPPETAVATEPITREWVVEPHTESYVIILAGDARLVTTIEFLSPTHKRTGEDRRQYLEKREEMRDAGVSVVEVDLVRAGDWRSLLGSLPVPPRGETLYRVTVWHARMNGRALLYFIMLRQRLPAIPIPLRATDEDVLLDLQPLLDRAYDGGRYNRTDYRRPLDPPLEGEDEAWAEQLLGERGT